MKGFIIAILTWGAAVALVSCTPGQVDQQIESEKVEGSIRLGSEEDANLKPERLPKKKWRKVVAFKGKKNQKTDAFAISDGEWQIKWQVEPGRNEDAEFIVIMHNVNDTEDSEMVATQVGPGEDFVQYEPKSGGEFYFEVIAKSVYTITVEEFKR